MRTITLFAVVAALLSTAAFAQDQGCDLQLAGATRQHIFMPYKEHVTGAGSDYWMSSGQKKKANETLDKAFGQKASVSSGSNEAIGPLILGCRSEDGKTSLSVYTTSQTGSDHIVFGPKEYVLDSAWEGKQGHVGILLSKINDERYSIDGSGKFNVTKFDATGITGTFELNVKNKKTSEPAKLSGTFNLPCKGDLCKK